MVTENNKKTWVKPLIIAGAIIVGICLIGVFTLWGFTSYLKYEQENVLIKDVMASETQVEEKVKETVVKQEVKTEETAKEVAKEEKVEETTVEQEAKTEEKVKKVSGFEPYTDPEIVPDNDATVFQRAIAPGHMLAYTTGPADYLGYHFPGTSEGKEIGTVIVVRVPEGNHTQIATFEDVVGGAGWARDYTGNDIFGLGQDRIKAMLDPKQENCSGYGCIDGVDYMFVDLTDDGPVIIEVGHQDL